MTLQDVENARTKYYHKLKRGIIITAVISIIAAVVLFAAYSQEGFFAIFPAFFAAFFVIASGLGVTTVVTSNLHKEYNRAYKVYFVERNLQSVFTNLNYSHEQGLACSFLDNTGMVDTGDRYSSNDFASGKYKDVGFSQADVHIENEHTDSDGNTHYTTIFRGRYMVFEFPKSFSFKLELIGKNFHAYKIPGKNSKNSRKMQKISTESNEFNDSFHIYGEDGFEAYYILDPAFIVKIQNIYHQHNGKVLLCFIDNHLIIGLNDDKDSFEPPKSSKPINEATELQKISTDIKTITDFIDQLSLDRKLFK